MKKILLVEDEALIAENQAQIITGFGHEVCTAYTGETAVECVRTDPAISLVLMDIDLGKGINGPQAAEQILAIRQLPIVFLTSHAERAMVEKVRGITRYGYVIKNSGDFVLQSSIEMAFELFEAHERMAADEERYRVLFENSINAVGLHRIVLDDAGIPVDYIFISVNAAFERHTGLVARDILGKRVTQIFPDIVKSDLIPVYGRVALTGEPSTFEIYFEPLDRYFNISVYQAGYGNFAVVFENITERKLALDRLADRNRFIESLMNLNPDVVYIYDIVARNNVYSNDSIQGVLGYTADELKALGETMLINLMHPDDFGTYRNTIIPRYMTASDGERIFHSYRLRHKNGQWRWLESHETIYSRQADGAPREIFGVIHDVTDQVLLRQRFEHIQDVGKGLFDYAIDCVIHTDPRGNFIDINPAGCAMLGAAHGDVIGKNVADFLFPEELAKNPLRFADVQTGMPVSNERRIRRADGSFFIGEINGRMLPNGSLMAIIRDITDRRQMEQDLVQAHLQLKSIFNCPSDLVIRSIDREYRYIFFNQAYAAAMQRIYGAEIALGMQVFQGIPLDRDHAKVKEYFDRAFSGESFSIIQSYGDGDLIYYENHVYPVVDEQGGIIGATAYSMDITPRIRLEQQMRTLIAEKELLLKEMHHRIKNNMNVIATLLSLQSRTIKNREAEDALQMAINRIQSMNVLYEKLYLTESRHMVSIAAYFPVLIAEILALFHNSDTIAIDSGFDEIEIEGGLLSTLGIIVNELITNALKYAFQGGGGGRIAIFGRRHNNGMIIDFSDNGTGFPETINCDTTPGLGLRLIGLMVKQIGGTLEIRRDAGTRFIITLPL